MIKRDPQEITDFFGCEVLVNPFSETANLYADGDSGYCIGYLKKHTVVSCENHDKTTIIFEPQRKQENSENKNRPCYQDFTDSDNNAPHQSEVHTHREYVLLGEFSPSELCVKVSEYLEKGFKLYGYPWTGPDCGRCGYIHYQAMVRGLE